MTGGDRPTDLHEHVATLFPVEAAMPDGSVVRRAKVFVLSGGVIVYGEDEHRVPVKLFTARHVAPPELPNFSLPKRKQHAVMHTAEGDLHVTQLLGCGCGSQLKGLRWQQVVGQ